MSRRRSISVTPGLPPPYTPPTTGGSGGDTGTPTHPEVTRRQRSPRNKLTLQYAKGKCGFLYGRQKVAGNLLYSFDKPYGNEFWYVVGFTKGESKGLVKVHLGNAQYTPPAWPLPITGPGFSIWFHKGTLGQTVNANFAGVDPTWNEALPGITYAIIKLDAVSNLWPQIPQFKFEGEWRLAVHPSTGVAAYSELPAVQFYDWLLQPEGKNLRRSRIYTPSWVAAEAICAELVNGKPRFTSHASIEGGHTGDIEKTFALMCDGLFFFSRNQWHLVIDRPAEPVAAYTDSDFIAEPTPEAWREDPWNRINEVIIEHTDRAKGWKVVPRPIRSDALKAGREVARTATYHMPWLHDVAVVDRKLAYLLAGYTFDFKLQLRHRATTTDRTVGDVFTQSVASRAIAAQKFRLISREKSASGDNTFMDVLLEYNDGRYASVISTEDSKIASTNPDPSAIPPDVTGFTTASITEELFQAQVGFYEPRARITWTYPTFSWLDAVEIHFSIDGGEFRFYDDYSGEAGSPGIANFAPVMELRAYTFKLIVRSRYGPRSAGVTVTKTFAGKITPPTNVPVLNGRAAGGDVLLDWQPAVDLDLLGYEVRRILASEAVGLTAAQRWTRSGLLDRVSGTQYRETAPYAAWIYLVKAYDSGRHYSATAAARQVVNSRPSSASVSTTNLFSQYSPFALHGGFSRRGAGQAVLEVHHDGSERALLAREITGQQIQDQIDAIGPSATMADWAAANPGPVCYPLWLDTTRVVSVAVTAAGSGYPAWESVEATFSAPQLAGGFRAKGFAVAHGSGQISFFNLESAGSGYTSPPTITLAAGDGSGATFSVTLGDVAAATGDLLVAGANAYSYGTAYRNYQYRFHGKGSERLGDDSPDIVAKAGVIMDGSYGPVVEELDWGTTQLVGRVGVRFSTNSARGQEIIQNAGAPATNLITVTKQRIHRQVQAGTIVTDGSGNASVAYGDPMVEDAFAHVTLTVEVDLATNVRAKLVAGSNNAAGFTVRTYNPATNAAVGGVTVHYDAWDRGGGGTDDFIIES